MNRETEQIHFIKRPEDITLKEVIVTIRLENIVYLYSKTYFKFLFDLTKELVGVGDEVEVMMVAQMVVDGLVVVLHQLVALVTLMKSE